jgi:hypothetical protein
MRKLESMITEFVGDLLRTIGEASVDDLRELFAGAPQGQGALKISAEPVSFTSLALPGLPSRPAPPPRTPQGETRRHGKLPRRTFLPLSSLPPIPSAPPGVAEITDPESLLSLGLPREASGSNGVGSGYDSNAAPLDRFAPTLVEPSRSRSRRSRVPALLEVSESATLTPVHGEHDVESPASGVRAIGNGTTIKLSDNETLARVSNSGVVIRRKKRA